MSLFKNSTHIVSIVKEQLLAHFDGSIWEDADFVIAIDANDLWLAIGIERVIGEADFVALVRNYSEDY